MTRAATFVLLVLLAFGEAHFAQATLNIIWRAFVLSFDNPASQQRDEIASDGSVYSDGGRDACAAITPIAGPRRVGASCYQPPTVSHCPGSDLSRSPPSSSLA